MASFAPNKIDTTAINGGQRYQNGDVVDANAINAPIEASAWAQQAAEEAQVKADYALQKVNESEIGEITLSAYPIGSIYLSVVDTSPASIFGGTWEKIKDRFLLASGDKYANGATGGSVSTTHSHETNVGITGGYIYADAINGASAVDCSSGQAYAVTASHQTVTTTVRSLTTSVTIDNMPPYLAVNAWKRIS